MSGRIEKPKKSHDNKEYRAVKSEYIRSFGFESVPCSRCFDTSNRCFVVDGINRCDGCFLSGRACDCPRVAMSSRMLAPSFWSALVLTFLVVQRINSELKRLEEEEARAEALMEERQRQLNESLARISRLRKMQRMLKSKGVEMIRRDLSSMEELEEEERKEAEEKARKEELERVQRQEQEALAQMQQACSTEVFNWSGVPLSDESLAGLLEGVAQGDFGGTPSASAERPSGS